MLIRKENNKAFFIYKTVYIIVHYLYSIFEYVYDTWCNVKQTVSSLYHRTVYSENNLAYIYSEAHKLGKIPNHLTILLGHEHHSIKDLSNFILWSLAAGVSFISFYDSKGKILVYRQNKQMSKCMYFPGDLKRKETELHVAVEKNWEKIIKSYGTTIFIYIRMVSQERKYM